MGPVNEHEARQRCEELQAEHPDRETHTWVPVPGESDEWSVAKISVPPGPTVTGTETRSEAKPPAEAKNLLAPWQIPRPGA